MSVKIITLVENFSDEKESLYSEHGLSFYIEKNGQKIIFDTGQSELFLNNAEKLGLNCTTVDKIVISHGHYDHSGGLLALLDKVHEPAKKQLYMHEKAFAYKYRIDKRKVKYLGNPFSKKDVESTINLRLVKNSITTICEGVHILSNFERKHNLETIAETFKVCKGKIVVPDDFYDEIMLVIETRKGLFLLCGCSHPGIMNMIDTVISVFPQKIYAVVGGTHLSSAEQKRIDATVKYFEKLDCEIIGLSHCTGAEAVKAFKNDKRFIYNCAGTSFIVD